MLLDSAPSISREWLAVEAINEDSSQLQILPPDLLTGGA
jgi:hypothetical protein